MVESRPKSRIRLPPFSFECLTEENGRPTVQIKICTFSRPTEKWLTYDPYLDRAFGGGGCVCVKGGGKNGTRGNVFPLSGSCVWAGARVCKVEEKVERGEMFPHLWIVRLGERACVYKVEEKMERGEMSPHL